MQSTSNQFKTAVKNSGRHFKSYVMINGTKYESIDGMEIKYGIIQGDDIGIGNCYISSLSITLKGVTTTPKFLGQKIIPYIGLQLDDTGTNFEYLKMGVFKVQTANVVDRSIVITANDNMQLAHVGFFSNLKGNQKITAIMNEQCQKLGISFVGGADDVAIDVSKLEGLKIIEAMSLMSAYCGKNAIANREGNIEFKWFNDVAYEIGPNRYPSPLTVGEKDFVVNGVSCVVDKDTTLSSGLTTGKVISISNQFMTQARLDTIFNKVKSFTYRTCNLTYTMCDPSLEVGDIVTIKDVKGNKYKVPLFNFSVKFTGGCAGAIECFGKTDEQKSNQNGGFLSKKVERNYTEYISTKELLADTIVAYDGKFGKVETDYLQVNVEISALSGKFGTISSDLANFKVTNTEQLNAINAKINTLETVDLKAITATIAQANIDIGKINTLLAGTVTAGSGQYIVLNAQNTVISNALIKSAMIDTLDFNKITGVDINTTNLKIHSKDGMSQWFDNTIQIKDANRSRVQIGKDASGDYNIYVWDKLGKLMFDATGVTADGIQKPIIRDDMVATNANISGDKLNITSVITKINANSTLIESSHVKYDGKSLDVAFNSLQTTVDGIQIGGRNLCLNTKPYSNSSNWAYAWGTINILDEPTAISKKCMCYTVTTPIVNTAPFYNAIPSGVVVVGKEYTWSVYVKTSKNMQLRIGQENGGYKTFNVTTEWQEFKYTYVASVSSGKAFVFYPLKVADLSVGDKIYVHSLMLVEGNKIGTWQEAPEDTDGQIATLTESIKSQSTQISVAQGQIGTLISDVSQSKSDIATVKGGLTTATGNISTLQSNYSALNQTVSGLSSTVGSHTSSITTLTETANTALSKIDGLEIGGTNIATNTNQGIINWSWGMQVGDYTRTTVEEDGILCCKLTKGDIPRSGWNYISYSGINRKKYLPNKQYTISFDIKASVACFVNVQLKNSDSTYPLCPGYTMGKTIPNTWVTLSAIITTIDSFPTSMNQILYITGFDTTIGVTYIFRNLIISEGNKRPPWSPAPEDVDNRITTEIKTVTDKQASFDVLLTGITGRVSATESTVTTVTNTVNNNKANWDKAPTALANANSAQTTANTANTLANANKTNLANLTTTVTETKTAVSNLQLDYNGFKTTVSETYTTKTEFGNLEIGGVNLLVKKTVTKGKYLNAAGAEVVDGQWFYSDYIPVTGIQNIVTSGYTNLGISPSTCYYDSNKKFIKGINNNGQSLSKLISISSGIAYIRFSGMIADLNNELKLEKGTKSTGYSPSPDDIDASIATVDGKFVNYSTTTQMNSAIDQTKNSITQSVASTYATQSALGGLTTRIATAESKITDSAIVNTVRKSVDYTNDLNKKTEKTEILSTINQSAEAIKIKANLLELSGYVTIDNAVQKIETVIDLSSATYDTNTFYPVVGTRIPYNGYRLFELNVQLNSNKPSWSTHANGFTSNITARMKASGWGTTDSDTLGWLDDFSHAFCNQSPAYISQMTSSSLPVFWLRGGGKYYVYTDYICNWSIKTTSFTASNEIIAPIALPNKPTNLSYLGNNWTNDKAIGTWCYNNDVTFIDGGKIYTGTITAEKIKATTLSAISANLGSVTAGAINIGSGKFVVDSAGNLTANNAKIEGTINATSGSIGDFVIMSGAITSGYTTSGGRLENYLTLNKTMFEVVLTGVGNARCAYNYIGVTATSTNSSKTTWMDGNQIFTNGSITANEYNTVHGNEIVFNSSSNGIYFGYRPGSNGNKVNTWIFCNGTNVATGNGTIECGDITAKGSAWIGWQCASGGDWFGFYNGSHGTRQGWIGHNSSNDFNFTNEKSGNFVFNRAVRATGLYNTNIGAWTTHSNNIDLFTDIKDYFEIRGPGYAKGIYYTVSDIKFKKDVMPTGVNNAMDIINQLEHVQFNWIDGGKHVDIGYIANDVRDIMEGLTFNVKQPDGSDQYNINQTTFLPLVTKGMQELSKTLDTHDDRLANLEKENESLKLALSKEIQLRIDLEGRFNQLRTTI